MTLVDSVYRFRRQVIRRAQELRDVSQACREAGIPRALFYRRRKRDLAEGADGLRPRPQARGRHPRRAPPALEDVRIEDLQRVLDSYLRYDNFDRRHQGYRLRGRVPADLFYPTQLSTPDGVRTA
ncbi:MAG: helix-turn-helix domain-containing protein [Clostridia bacterium]|nr:helix-turn-helix domain-containing protein [Clostridia bacterium]